MIVVFGSINVDLVFALPSLPQPGETVLGRIIASSPAARAPTRRWRRRATAPRSPWSGGSARRLRRVRAEPRCGGRRRSLGCRRLGARPTGCAAICVDTRGATRSRWPPAPTAMARATQLARESARRRHDAAAADGSAASGERGVDRAGQRARLPHHPESGAGVEAGPRGALGGGRAGRQRGRGAWLAACSVSRPASRRRWHARCAAWLNVTVVMTLGERGAIAATGDATWSVGALAVTPVDTTAAGDCFVGVLAASLDRGDGLGAALHRASVAAGLACMKPGAQPSLPLAAEIDKLGALAPARRSSGGRRRPAAGRGRRTRCRADIAARDASGVRPAKAWPRRLAVRMTAPLTTRPIRLSIVASSMICSATEPALGCTNCGNRARTNKAILGLSRLVTRPWRNTTRDRMPAQAGGGRDRSSRSNGRSATRDRAGRPRPRSARRRRPPARRRRAATDRTRRRAHGNTCRAGCRRGSRNRRRVPG